MIAASAVASLICGCGQVDTGEAGFLTRWGEIISREPLSEGLHFYEPFGTDLITYNIKNQMSVVKTEVFTRDLQAMKLEMTVTYCLDRTKIIDLHSKTGKDFAKILIAPTVLNSAKDVLGKMEAGEIVEKRECATKAIFDTIQQVLMPHGIIVSLVNITDIDYSDAYEKAVEAKQVAQQEAQREKNETLKIKERSEQEIVRAEAEAKIKQLTAEAEAKAILVKAEAEAKAIDLKNKSLAASPAIIQYTLAQQWDGKLPVQMLGGGAVPFINIDKVKEK
ncbi:MAG: hypothetical protein MJZ81_11870 [Bacteroidales bacterium]|nr:hypothetical protein [Bacteroidales bacterium]